MAIALGDICEGVVTGVTKFGAFVKLDDGTTGLVHISEVADTFVKEVSDFIKMGDKVKAKVVNIGDNGKVGLSIKQAAPKPAPQPAQRNFPPREREGFQPKPAFKQTEDFEDKLAEFMKSSTEKLNQLKRHQEGKKR